MNKAEYHDAMQDAYNAWISKPIVPRAVHNNAGDAVFSIMERLYDGAATVDEEGLRQDFAYLCDKFDVDDQLLEDPHGLCVEHYSARRSIQQYHDSKMNIIRKNLEVLVDQLSGASPVDADEVQNALDIICSETSVNVKKVNIQRKTKRSELFDFALALAQSNAK